MPQAITARNAKEKMEEAARALRGEDMDDGERAGALPDPPPAPDADQADGGQASGPQGSEPPTDGGQANQPPEGTQQQETEGAPESGELADLRRQHLALQKQFKALQAAITRPQQINAELRRKITALEAELQEAKSRADAGAGPDKSQSEDHELKAKLSAIREMMPEAADLLETTVAENRRLRGDVDQRLNAQESLRHAEASRKAQEMILSAQPDAFTIANSDGFQKWKASLGPETAETFDAVLANSFVNGEDGVRATLSILDAYLATQGGYDPAPSVGTPHVTPPASRPAMAQVPVPPAHQAPATPRPTDMAVPTRVGTRPVAGVPATFSSDSQLAEADIRIRRNPKDALSIAEQIKAQMLAQSRRR